MAFITLNYKSMALMRSVTVNVFLPTDMMLAGAKPPFKTLYFLPGHSADSMELCTYFNFRAQSELKGIAIVIPNGDNSFYLDHPGRNSNYSTFVGKELVEVTRQLLPLSDKREDTYIGGISMGGYGALRNGMLYRDTFSKIVAMSPGIEFKSIMCQEPSVGFTKEQFVNLFGEEEEYFKSDTYLDRIFENVGKETIPELFLCCGRQDILVYEQNKAFAEKLSEWGIPHTYREIEGNHDVDTWERMMDPAFSFLAGIEEGTRNRLAL